MKKLFLLALIALFLSGCGTMLHESEFWKHDTHYQTFDHAAYSWGGYKNPTDQTYSNSRDQKWWGIPTPK